MNWEEMTRLDMDRTPDSAIAVLPVGAVEQHGRHLPLATDSIINHHICQALDAACAGALLVLPVQKIGSSDHHLGFRGTLSVTHETFLAHVMDVLGCVHHHRFRRVILLNSHGGNQAICGVAAEKAARNWPDMELVFTAWWRVAAARLKGLVEGEYPATGHACELETSLMLHYRPELVAMDEAVDDGVIQRAPQLRGDLLSAGAATMVRSFSVATREGGFGKPSLASAQKGQRIEQAIIDSLVELIGAVWPDYAGAKEQQ